MKVYGQLEKAILEKLASDPATGVEGQVYFNTTDKAARVYRNGAWTPMGATSSSLAQDVASSASAGTSVDSARADHVHKGVHSVAKNGSSQLFGDVTFSQGSNVTITQVGNDLTIAATAPGAGAVVSPGSYPVTLSASDDGKTLLIDTTAARTINAFAASANFRITLKDKTGTAQEFPITFVRSGSQKIEGLSADYVMEANWGEWNLAFDGTDWFLSN